jgi:glycosyltransferase involved in cell wall biosynthesis
LFESRKPANNPGLFAGVSVVVPTIGRPEMARALRSVRAQTTNTNVELIVVDDSRVGTKLPAEVHNLADRVVRTPGRVGGSRARNIGIQSATNDVVALLDDDDEWLPNKLEIQLTALGTAPNPKLTVIAGRQVYVNADTDVMSRPGPDRLMSVGEPVEQYLFRRRPPSGGRPSIYTSTLLCPRELAMSTPWDDSLTRHQDWDWLVRLGRIPGTSFLQVPDPVVKIHLGSASSISACSDWRASLDWANRTLVSDPKVYADFVVAQPLRYALAARSLAGVRSVLGALGVTKHLPAAGPALIGVGGLLPRKTIERVTVLTGGVRS